MSRPACSQTVVQVYKQKVKHLLYEHQQNIAALKVEAAEQLRQARDQASERIRELMVDKQNLQRDYDEQVSIAALSIGKKYRRVSGSDQMRSPWLLPAATAALFMQITWQVLTVRMILHLST